MISMNFTPKRSKALNAAIEQVLAPAQITMVREFLQAEDPMGPAPRASDMLSWIRMNMPMAAVRIEELLYPND